jgi:hypothetical protein
MLRPRDFVSQSAFENKWRFENMKNPRFQTIGKGVVFLKTHDFNGQTIILPNT